MKTAMDGRCFNLEKMEEPDIHRGRFVQNKKNILVYQKMCIESRL